VVKRIVGLDDNGKKVFERDAREYDTLIANTKFGVTLGDIVKAVPVIFLCGMLWMKNESAWENQIKNNLQMTQAIQANTSEIKNISSNNSKTLSFLQDYIFKMDNYLSSTTGKRFKNGEPQQ
jgi:hypothetical protein